MKKSVKVFSTFSLIAFCFIYIMCHEDDLNETQNQFTYLESNLSRDSSPSVPESDFDQFNTDNNTFAFELYRNIIEEEESNIFFSPMSISFALAMIYAGAKNNTEAEMADTLNFSLSQELLHPAFNLLQSQLADPDEEGFSLNLANALWAAKSQEFLTDYLDTLATNYGTGVHSIDFSNPEQAREIINNWVSEQTMEMIQNLIKEGQLSTDTTCVLTNAIYFFAEWYHKFDSEDTKTEEFTLLNDQAVSVPMMNISCYYQHARGDGFDMIELFYKNTDYSMVVILPDADNFTTVEQNISYEIIQDALNNLSSQYIILSLPKWENALDISLVSMLQSLGMYDAFDLNSADFTGMFPSKGYAISEVIHQASITVNEEGTEAAAATAVIVTPGIDPQPLVININRPFIYFIRNTSNNAILFLGRVLDPS